MIHRLLAIAVPLLLAACAAPIASRDAAGPATGGPVTVGIVAINDFHGNLEPPHQSVLAPDGQGGVVQVPAGGAAWLASAIDSVRAKYPNHLTVSAGDLIGASQVASSLFLDEPAIGVMNRIGLDFNAVGNHEFDHGPDELLRIANGGCAKFTDRAPCAIEPYPGARFPFLAANTLTASGAPLFAPTGLKTFGEGARRVTIGFIGVTLRGTGALSTDASRAALHWADEADTINALAPGLKAQGADVVVVLIHQGGRTRTDPPLVPDPNRCDGFYGDIRPILDRLSPLVDVVISGHTHWAYICDYPVPGHARPLLLTSAGLWGEELTDITLRIDPATHALVSRAARNVIVQSPGYQGAKGYVAPTPRYPSFAPRADIAAYVQRYVDAAAVVARRKVGALAGPAAKTEGALSNTGGVLGRLIADSQLAATRRAGAEIALMNPFGIRTSLVPEPDGAVTYGAAYAVEPFNNNLITLTLSGAELKAVLEQGFDGAGPEQVLTPSAGFGYAYDRARPAGERVVAMTLNGRPIDPARGYRVTVSEFLAKGGDSFTGFTKGRDATRGAIDLAALIDWLNVTPPRALPPDARDVDRDPALNREDPNRVAPPGHTY